MTDIIISAIIAGLIIRQLITILGKKKQNNIRTSKQNQEIQDGNFEEMSLKEAKLELKLDSISKQHLIKIKDIDTKFSLINFIHGATKSFSIIIKALDENDITTLKKFLSTTALVKFKDEINKRKIQNIKYETKIVRFKKTDIIKIELDNNTIKITLDITSEQFKINTINITESDHHKKEMLLKQDIWIFTKKTDNKYKLWELHETI